MAEHVFSDPLLDVYYHENTQLLEQLEGIILNCEAGTYSEKATNEIFRVMHTIKGSSTMMNFSNVARLAHTMEDLFSYIRSEQPEHADYTVLSELVLQGIDFMKLEFYKIRNGHPMDGDETSLVSELQQYLAMLSSQHEEAHVKAIVFFEDEYQMENVRAFQVVHQLQEWTDRFSYEPEDIQNNNDTAEIIRKEGFHLYFRNRETVEEVQAALSQAPCLKHLEIIPLQEEHVRGGNHASARTISDAPAASAAEQLEKTHTAQSQLTAGQSSNFISINVNRLDELMDLVGELVIAESMVTQSPDLAGHELEQFRKAARQLRKITGEIQDKVMSIRMVPLSNTFQKMNRIVRDICKKQGKSVKLELVGEDTEVDKNVIERISDPIMHMVRNSLDHGIETPEERLSAGKPSTATLTLEARNVGSEVFVVVRDDGRGLNKEKIIKRALENGLLPKQDGALELPDHEIFQLIFLPGFSTKESITEFSGRGVGMDVVMSNMMDVGGSVSVASVPGEGTAITMRIPLTLAIIDGMNVKVGQARYTIPTTAIRESFRAAADQIITDPDGAEMIMVRGECYQVLRLHERFGVETAVKDMQHGILIMVEYEHRKLCLFADELIGQQQVVVKNLPAYIKKIRDIKGLAGCTMLGDGSISLILDIGGLLSGRL